MQVAPSSNICHSTENSTDDEAELVPGHMPPPPVLFVPSSPAPRMRVPRLRLQLPYMVNVGFEVFVSSPLQRFPTGASFGAPLPGVGGCVVGLDLFAL